MDCRNNGPDFSIGIWCGLALAIITFSTWFPLLLLGLFLIPGWCYLLILALLIIFRANRLRRERLAQQARSSAKETPEQEDLLGSMGPAAAFVQRYDRERDWRDTH